MMGGGRNAMALTFCGLFPRTVVPGRAQREPGTSMRSATPAFPQPRDSGFAREERAPRNDWGRRYFFGTSAFNFSMSAMFILMPPGITMSPGFWPSLQGPSHLASSAMLAFLGTPGSGFSFCDVTLTV